MKANFWTFDFFSFHQRLFIFETWLISHNSSFEWNHGWKNSPKVISHHTWYCKLKTHPENLSQLPWVHWLVTWAGEVPLNILTWPSLTFLAARQTFVYQRLFIKHTLLIIKAIISSISELGNILSREKTERQRVGWGLHQSGVLQCCKMQKWWNWDLIGRGIVLDCLHYHLPYSEGCTKTFLHSRREPPKWVSCKRARFNIVL